MIVGFATGRPYQSRKGVISLEFEGALEPPQFSL